MKKVYKGECMICGLSVLMYYVNIVILRLRPAYTTVRRSHVVIEFLLRVYFELGLKQLNVHHSYTIS